MKPYVSDPDFTLYVGDALEVLRELPDESVHCCVTSPPYWGLRDYGRDGQLGLESSPAGYVVAMVAVFAEVRRVLRTMAALRLLRPRVRRDAWWHRCGYVTAANPLGRPSDRELQPEDYDENGVHYLDRTCFCDLKPEHSICSMHPDDDDE